MRVRTTLRLLSVSLVVLGGLAARAGGDGCSTHPFCLVHGVGAKLIVPVLEAPGEGGRLADGALDLSNGLNFDLLLWEVKKDEGPRFGKSHVGTLHVHYRPAPGDRSGTEEFGLTAHPGQDAPARLRAGNGRKILKEWLLDAHLRKRIEGLAECLEFRLRYSAQSPVETRLDRLALKALQRTLTWADAMEKADPEPEASDLEEVGEGDAQGEAPHADAADPRVLIEDAPAEEPAKRPWKVRLAEWFRCGSAQVEPSQD